MATPEALYTGNGATTTYAYAFDTLDQAHVKASLDGVDTAAFTIPVAGQVQFNTAPTNGAAIRIYRLTPDDSINATFTPGSALRSQDLNSNFEQLLFVTQEDRVTSNNSDAKADLAIATAEGAVVTADAAVVTADAAVVTADAAVVTADAADAKADTAIADSAAAVITADNAEATAISAAADADAAVIDAAAAVIDAAAAVITANDAESIANSALDIVAGTVQYVPIADVASIPGTPDDGDAIQVVDSTGIEGFTPLAGLPGGFTGAAQLFIRLQYTTSGTTWNYIGYGANDPDGRYVIQGELGTAALPSYYFDADTGVYSPGANELGLSTGGAARLTIDSAGGVAIPGTLSVTGGVTGSLTGSASANILRAGDTMTGALGVTAGSATAPSVFFTGDTNTGIYSPGADQVAISSNGSGRLFIDASGNVGINTASTIAPAGYGYAREFALTGATSGDSAVSLNIRGSRTVAGGFGDINFWHQSTSNRAYIQARRGSSDSAIDLDFITSGGAGMRLDSSGRLGLGTSSPGAAFQIVSSTSADQMRIGPNTTDYYKIGRDITLGKLTFEGVQQSYSGYDFKIYPTSGSAATSALVIKEGSGNVGIGTTSPQELLHVNTGSSGGQVLRMSTNGADTGYLYQNSGAVLLGASSTRVLGFETNGSERARITSSGQLLVGTSSSPTVGDAQYGLLRVQGNTSSASGFGLLSIGRGQAAASIASGSELGHIHFTANDGSPYAVISGYSDNTSGSSDYPGRLTFSVTRDGQSSPSEAMRISNNGTTRVRTTANAHILSVYSDATSGVTTSLIDLSFEAYAPNNTTAYFLQGRDTSDLRFRFRANGGLENYSANNVNLSDRNVKKDIAPAAGTWDCLKEWEIVNFRYKDQSDDADLNMGVIAQQVAESCPEVITVFQEATEDQPEKLGIKEQQMMWMAIKALQEAQLRIESLEAKVAALEGV